MTIIEIIICGFLISIIEIIIINLSIIFSIDNVNNVSKNDYGKFLLWYTLSNILLIKIIQIMGII